MNKTWNVRGRLFDLSTPRVMGILNITPDSFYDGNRFMDESAVLQQVEKMVEEGADLIDVGGYSSRPGAQDISVEEETQRIIPFIKSITKSFPDVILSLDTFRSAVAREALDYGVGVINDISGGERDPTLVDLAAAYGTPYIIMHMRGNPQNMSTLTHYDSLMKEISASLRHKVDQLKEKGIKDMAVDPGFGFAKTIEQNFEILRQLEHLQILGQPVLAGLSRKSMIWKTLETGPEDALNGTTVLNTVALMKGVSILRVHDVKEAKSCVRLIGHLTA